ncbi:MAG: acyltransferase family protein [Chitinophagales bacterium]
MTTAPSLPINKRAVHFDLVRFIATFIVVELHVSTPWLWRDQDMHSGFWITCLFFDTLGRMGVPIFLMISGALLLNKQESYSSFFKKRFTRVFIPLVFWTIVYEIRILANHHYLNGSIDWSQWRTLLKNPLEGPVYDHLWFLYMIIGMYLVTPFLRKVIPVLGRKDLIYLLCLWIFSNILLPLLYNYTDFRLGFAIPVLSAYLGFYVLGYYIMHYQFSAKQIRIAWFVFAGVFILNIWTVWFDSVRHGTTTIFFLAHHRPGIFLQACSGFILLEHYAMHAFARFSEKKYKFLAYLGGTTFGIYLLHPLIIELFEGLTMEPYSTWIHKAPVLVIPIVSIIITAVTMGIVSLMLKLPLFKKFV